LISLSIRGDLKGKRKLVYADGLVYEGKFFQDALQGKGKLTSVDGLVMEGNFRKGVINGEAKATGKNGYSFVGPMVNGRKHGFGKIVYNEGRYTYACQFENDEINGEGGNNNGVVYVESFKRSVTHTL